MHRTFVLLVLVATAACGPAPRPISPISAPPRVAAKPSPLPPATDHGIPGLEPGEGMPVVVTDTTRLERMPVSRSDLSNDRAMVAPGSGSRFRLRGPAKVLPDSSLRIVP